MGNTNEWLKKLSDASVKHRMTHSTDTTWKSSLSTDEILDALRRNHESMNRHDSIYMQAELKILSLLDTMSMVAELASTHFDDNDIRLAEIKRLTDLASK